MNDECIKALDEIETFVRLRFTLSFAEEGPRRMRAQLMATRIGDSFGGQLSESALDAMQRAYMLKDLLTTFGTSERLTDWTSMCLAHVQELRRSLRRVDAAMAA